MMMIKMMIKIIVSNIKTQYKRIVCSLEIISRYKKEANLD